MGKKHTTEEINESANQYFGKERIYNEFEIQKKLGVKNRTAYIGADAFLGNPYSLLGRVMMIEKNNGQCPDGINTSEVFSDFTPTAITGIEIDEDSKIERPEKRGSIIVTKSLSANVSFLNYLSGEFGYSDSFSIMLYDQLTGLVDVRKPSWEKGLNEWVKKNQYLIQDPDVCYLYAIIGIVQKRVIRKSYRKFDAKAKGGAYGININGELHTSTEDFSLDIRYGLTPVILKSPTFTVQATPEQLITDMSLATEMERSTKSLVGHAMKNINNQNYSLPNEEELNVFGKIQMGVK